ncbi:MAG TPA: DUF4123 domain-containing protein [Gemmatimonadaceae bacterium]
MTPQHLSVLEQSLWPKGRRRDVWMIVDAARDQRIYGLLLDCFYSERTCLFAGQLTPQLEMAAPYLIRLEFEGAKTRRFLSHAWGNEWGVFLRTDLGLDDLKRHLRDLLVVRDPSGRIMVFRYYDPRVLRVYLPTCTSDELRTVFGDIECFWMEDDQPATVLNAGFDKKQLVVNKLPLPA